MDKINFKNYEDEQTTPINAQALNAIQDNVESAINNIDVSEKADITYVDSELELKADITYVDSELELKADTTYVNTELGKKADTTYVNTELGLKADITYVDSELELKADIATTYTKTETDNSLGLKADTTYVNTELGKKANTTYVNTELGKKADTTYVDTELNKKEDKIVTTTNANRRAIKYSDGTLICSGRYVATNTPINVAVGSVAHKSAPITLPGYLVEFIDPPAITFGIEQNITANRLLSVNPQAAAERTDRPPIIFIGSLGGTVSGYAEEFIAPKISYIAIGKWK